MGRFPGPLLLLVGGLLLVGALLLFYFRMQTPGVSFGESEISLREAWEAGRYEEVLEAAEEIFSTAPLDPQGLVFAGFAHFYQGVNEVDQDNRATDLANATRHLRRALLLDRPPAYGEVSYVLAKSYFHRGPFYHDLVVEYMEQAIEAGYVADDSYEYLSLAYETLGGYQDSIRSLEKALERNPSDLILLTLGQLYRRVGDYPEAQEKFSKAISSTTDSFLKQEALYGLGALLLEQGKLDEAEAQYRAILANNARAADAHYRLGLVYQARNDEERARFEWRQAISIDPNHEEALRSLRGR
jgi:tetratricopeptide (TPR) repeat protein